MKKFLSSSAVALLLAAILQPFSVAGGEKLEVAKNSVAKIIKKKGVKAAMIGGVALLVAYAAAVVAKRERSEEWRIKKDVEEIKKAAGCAVDGLNLQKFASLDSEIGRHEFFYPLFRTLYSWRGSLCNLRFLISENAHEWILEQIGKILAEDDEIREVLKEVSKNYQDAEALWWELEQELRIIRSVDEWVMQHTEGVRSAKDAGTYDKFVASANKLREKLGLPPNIRLSTALLKVLHNEALSDEERKKLSVEELKKAAADSLLLSKKLISIRRKLPLAAREDSLLEDAVMTMFGSAGIGGDEFLKTMRSESETEIASCLFAWQLTSDELFVMAGTPEGMDLLHSEGSIEKLRKSYEKGLSARGGVAGIAAYAVERRRKLYGRPPVKPWLKRSPRAFMQSK